jgi:hypothetical protein
MPSESLGIRFTTTPWPCQRAREHDSENRKRTARNCQRRDTNATNENESERDDGGSVAREEEQLIFGWKRQGRGWAASR